MVGIAGGLFLLALFVACWVLLPESVQERFDVFQIGTAILLAGIFGSVLWGVVRCRVTATEQGLVVLNGYKEYQYEWAEVLAIRMPRGAPWATLDLADGTTRPVIALQSADGERTLRAIVEIRTHLT